MQAVIYIASIFNKIYLILKCTADKSIKKNLYLLEGFHGTKVDRSRNSI